MPSNSIAYGKGSDVSHDRRVFSFEKARADGWLETLASGSPTFTSLCEVIGEPFVALALMAGVRITAVAYNRAAPHASLVDFTLSDAEPEQRLSLPEFRRRVVLGLIADELPDRVLGDSPSVEELQGFVGAKYVLLAPVFDLTIDELHVGGGREAAVVISQGVERVQLGLDMFRRVLRQRVQAELARSESTSSFSIDLALVEEAESALAAGKPERVVELIGSWPGPLGILLRTVDGQNVTDEVRAALAKALSTLGAAYVKQGQFAWAEEVLRLGIQWAREEGTVAGLFHRLGEVCVRQERCGEAIGLLRRALALGSPALEILPELARCFIDRGRFVAAMACLDEAIENGAIGPELEEIQARIALALGPAYDAYRTRVPRVRLSTGLP